MSDQNPKDLQDKERRNLLVATGGVGALGACAFVTPMVASFAPSVRAKASGGPVEVEIGDLKPGEQKVAEWRGKPVWILRRTEEMTAKLHAHDGELADPNSENLTACPCRTTATTNFVAAPSIKTSW